MTNDLPAQLRKRCKELSLALDQMQPPFVFAPFAAANNLHDPSLMAADEIDRLTREENALRGAYSAVLFERDALRSRLKLAEDVCHDARSFEASVYAYALAENSKTGGDLDAAKWCLQTSLKAWRSARDAKPKEEK